MAREDQAAGKVRQLRGRGNEIAGAIKGDDSQQMKGKIQRGVGKVQEKLGKLGSRSANRGTKRNRV
jgi:uncharacterized protein YjbJ (UPF0337 family)